MPVPDRVEAATTLLSLDPPPWFLRHARAVAEIAAWLALRIAERTGDGAVARGHGGRRVDRAIVEAAALLHDVDKLLDPSDPARRLPHGEGSARWLARQGWPELAPVVAAHPVTRLADDPAATTLLRASSIETRIVAYADKRAGQRLESVDERFASWERRYPPLDGTTGSPTDPGRRRRTGAWDRATMTLVRGRVARLEEDVCSAAGVVPARIRRLAWTHRALRAARDGDDRRPTHRSTDRGRRA